MIAAHIKSNESTKPYIVELFEKTSDWIWVLGKPFGIQELCNHLNAPDADGGFLKPGDTDKIAYIDESLGNALGTAIGISLANPNKRVICFISDAQLYMGSILESILAMQNLKIKNIALIIDYNKLGSRGIIPDFNFGIFGDIPVNRIYPSRIPRIKPGVWVLETHLLPKIQKFLTEYMQ